MLYAERHWPRGVGLAGAVHRTWAVAVKNDWQFSNPRIDTAQHETDFLSFQMALVIKLIVSEMKSYHTL